MALLRTLLASAVLSALPALAVAADPIFIRSWGAAETGAAQLNAPQGLATDSAGNVYVVDTNQVKVFDASGSYLRTWGTSGSGNGQFDVAIGIAVDGSGNVYVADYYNNRVQVFDTQGTYLRKWGSLGTTHGQFTGPFDIAASTADEIYVSDMNNNRIEVFNSLGVYQRSIGSTGSGNGQLLHPQGLGLDAAANLYVTDMENHRVAAFSSAGAFLTAWGGYGTAPGQMSHPAGVAPNSQGDVYVADSGNNRLQVFSNSGSYKSAWGMLGGANGEFRPPMDVAVVGAGNIYVADRDNHRIQDFFDPNTITEPAAKRNGIRVVDLANPQFPQGNTASPGRAVGQPDAQTYSLGLNGSIVLELGEPVYDADGPDLGVWEENGVMPDEKADVYLSRDLVSWTYLGRVLRNVHDSQLFDIAGLGIEGATYVRITDVGAADYPGSPGFDLDAVTVIPEPAGLLLLTPALLAFGRRRGGRYCPGTDRPH